MSTGQSAFLRGGEKGRGGRNVAACCSSFAEKEEGDEEEGIS